MTGAGMRRSVPHDRPGALRFALAQAGAINGTADEHRIYLTKSGERLWQDLRRKGPGYGFPPELPTATQIKWRKGWTGMAR
jgi:hypothetical protein